MKYPTRQEWEDAVGKGFAPNGSSFSPDNVYVIRMDYPPHGSNGLGLFRVIYHATAPAPSPTEPYRTITLLTISVR